MFLRVSVLVLCCSLLSCKDLLNRYRHSTSGVSATEKTVLFDFRNPNPAAEPTVDSKTLADIHSHLPPCKSPSSPRITSMAKGSFTYAAEDETAYLIESACGTKNQVQVYSAGKLAASAETAYSAILKTFDLNHDDKNELLLTTTTARNGERTREATLQTFEKNSLRPVEDFGIVYHDWCALFAGADEARKKALTSQGLAPFAEGVVVSYLPHPGQELPNFVAQRFRAACPADPNAAPTGWKLVGTR